MPSRPLFVRFLDACLDNDEDKAARLLDRMTPWRGIAEIAADVAGPPLVRAVIGQLEQGRDELADGLEHIAGRLRSRR